MKIILCLRKLQPQWRGLVRNNLYEGIEPHELEIRPIPSFAELESVWPEVEAEQEKAKADNEAKAALADIDMKSIRALREWVAKQADAPQQIKDHEAAAKVERDKLLK